MRVGADRPCPMSLCNPVAVADRKIEFQLRSAMDEIIKARGKEEAKVKIMEIYERIVDDLAVKADYT